MNFIEVPKEINIKDMQSRGFSFSPLQYKGVQIKNANKVLLKDLLARKLTFSDKGIEVGSQAYISNSPKYFIRNKALQEESFLPMFITDSYVPILPSTFKNYDLKEGDILISKDSNIGEVVILDKDYPNYMFSGGIYRLPINRNKYYILAFLKSKFFKSQLDLKVPKGVTIRHAKTLFLDCYIPFPNQENKNEVIEYIEILVKSVIKKEKKIREKDEKIFKLIDDEINKNQINKTFTYEYPKLKELIDFDRINASIFSEKFKRINYLINNYKFGCKNIYELNFKISRGQNLQVTCIGKSIISDNPALNSYQLIMPKHISYYGTINEYVYIINPKIKKFLKNGDIIFGAEGFEKGRSFVILNNYTKAITNIHGITLNHLAGDINLSIFVKCFLDYLRKKEIIDIFSVGGNGGSLAQKYWRHIYFPNFPKEKQEQIVQEYYNSKPNVSYSNLNLNNYKDIDEQLNDNIGIIQLGKEIKLINNQLEKIIHKISNDEIVDIDFSFLKD